MNKFCYGFVITLLLLQHVVNGEERSSGAMHPIVLVQHLVKSSGGPFENSIDPSQHPIVFEGIVALQNINEVDKERMDHLVMWGAIDKIDGTICKNFTRINTLSFQNFGSPTSMDIASFNTECPHVKRMVFHGGDIRKVFNDQPIYEIINGETFPIRPKVMFEHLTSICIIDCALEHFDIMYFDENLLTTLILSYNHLKDIKVPIQLKNNTIALSYIDFSHNPQIDQTSMEHIIMDIVEYTDDETLKEIVFYNEALDCANVQTLLNLFFNNNNIETRLLEGTTKCNNTLMDQYEVFNDIVLNITDYGGSIFVNNITLVKTRSTTEAPPPPLPLPTQMMLSNDTYFWTALLFGCAGIVVIGMSILLTRRLRGCSRNRETYGKCLVFFVVVFAASLFVLILDELLNPSINYYTYY